MPLNIPWRCSFGMQLAELCDIEVGAVVISGFPASEASRVGLSIRVWGLGFRVWV